MARQFDRPSAGNMNTPAQIVRYFDKFLSVLETALTDITDNIAAIAAAQAAAAAADTKARSRMDDLPEVVFTGDYTGTIGADQLPRDIAVKRYDGTTNVSSSSTWTRTVESGTVTCTIGAATGVLNVTAIGSDAVVRVESARDGLTLRKKQALTLRLGDPPNIGGASGTSWTDTILTSTSSTSMATISDELTVTVGASGTVNLTAPLTSSPAPNSTSEAASPIEVFGIWQWWDGAAWVDLGTETASNPDCVIAEDPENGSYHVIQAASLSVTSSKPGLVAAASEKFRLRARNSTAAVTMNYGGTATATSS